jgi:hypothetical protein
MGGVHSQPVRIDQDAGCESPIDPQNRNLTIADIQSLVMSNFNNGTGCSRKANVPPEHLQDSHENSRANVRPSSSNSRETAELAKDTVKEL